MGMASSLKDLSFQAYSPQSSRRRDSVEEAEDDLPNHHPNVQQQQQKQQLENRAINHSHKNVGKCGSMENLLSALPRSLSDVGLADKGISLVSQGKQGAGVLKFFCFIFVFSFCFFLFWGLLLY